MTPLDIERARNGTLLKEVEALKEENRHLKRLASLEEQYAFSDKLSKYIRLAPAPLRLLNVLYKAYPRVLSSDALMDAMYADQFDEPAPQILKVYISYLRAALTPDAIVTQWGRGWGLSAEGKTHLENLLSGEPPSPTSLPRAQPRRVVKDYTQIARVLKHLQNGPKSARWLVKTTGETDYIIRNTLGSARRLEYVASFGGEGAGWTRYGITDAGRKWLATNTSEASA